jgi:hypothetical protein
MSGAMLDDPTRPGALVPVQPIRFLEDPDEPSGAVDPGLVMLTCANCGAAMDERKCKLICRCGYFLSCSDYY